MNLNDMIDGNVHALDKFMDEQDQEANAFEAMETELRDELEIELNALISKHDKIAKKHGFDVKFIDSVREMI